MPIPSILFALERLAAEGAEAAQSAAAHASLFFSMTLTVLMCLALLAFIFWLRYRALHPQPEPTTLKEALEESSFKASPMSEEPPPKPWNQRADWWKE